MLGKDHRRRRIVVAAPCGRNFGFRGTAEWARHLGGHIQTISVRSGRGWVCQMCSFFSVFINTFAKAFLYQILPVLVPGCKERFWCFVWWQLQTAVSSQVREEAFHPQDTIVGSSRNQPRGFDILGSWLVSFDINTILNTEVRSL